MEVSRVIVGSIRHLQPLPFAAIAGAVFYGRGGHPGHPFKLNPNSISVCPARDIGAAFLWLAWLNLPYVRYRTATKSRFDTYFLEDERSGGRCHGAPLHQA